MSNCECIVYRCEDCSVIQKRFMIHPQPYDNKDKANCEKCQQLNIDINSGKDDFYKYKKIE